MENADTMGERMERIRRISTDFLLGYTDFKQKNGMFHFRAKGSYKGGYYGKTDLADLRIFADFRPLKIRKNP